MRFGGEFSSNSSGVMSYTISELAPNSTYYVQVRAGNGCAAGAWGNQMKFTTTSKGTTAGKRFYKNFATQIIQSIAKLVTF